MKRIIPVFIGGVLGVVVTIGLLYVVLEHIIGPLPPLTGDDLARASEEAVNQLVTRHLILQAAAGQNFTLTEVEVDSRVDLLFGSYGDETLQTKLAELGL